MEKILVTVTTYPTLSKKYFETVCTAGFREDGTWIRIFPIPLRLLKRKTEDKKVFQKWQWIETDLKHSEHDDRPESYHIYDINNLVLGNRIEVGSKNKNGWYERWRYVKKGKTIYTNMSKLINLAHENKLSLAVLKPREIKDIVYVKYSEEEIQESRRKILEKQAQYDVEKKQLSLFEDIGNLRENFKFAETIPYKFSYRFLTDDGRHKLMIEDWELGNLYRNSYRQYGDEQTACEKVCEKYMDFIQNRDVYLFLGTTYKWHKMKGSNPFVIIGVFAPPKGVTSQQHIDFID